VATEHVHDLAIVLCGEAGQGIQTVEHVLTRVLKRSGYHVFATKEYMSRVRGGFNSTEIRVATDRVAAHVDRIDLLIPLGPGAIEHMGDRVAKDTIILGDCAVLGECSHLGGDHPIHDVPFTAMAEELGSKMYANVIGVGVIGGLLDANERKAEEFLEETFSRKGDKVVADNLEALAMGIALGRQFKEDGLLVANIPKDLAIKDEVLLNGAEAVATGAIAGGCNVIASYPMSPSTGVLVFLAKHAKEFDILAEQAEDEIAAINMALGAWYAGGRAMVTTSGGGFALMVEGISLAGIMESPVVVHLAQRPGPATGLPTRTEQADLNMVLYAGHGEFPRVIFAPGDIHQAFHLTRQAFDIADRFQCPVFVLTDQYTVDSYYNTPPISLSYDDLISHVVPTDADYVRYAITDDGVSPRGIPGLGEGLVKADSDEHYEDGTITEEEGVRNAQNEKRLRKAEAILEAAIPPRYEGPDEPELLVIGWGSTYHAIKEAIEELDREDVAHLHLHQVYPLPPEVEWRIMSAGRTVLVEGNATSQLGRLIRGETGQDIEDKLLKYSGMQFSVEEVEAHLRDVLKEVD
jgi:2-oxoglutarate ferredoxin oxidoreductase subunit alpha